MWPYCKSISMKKEKIHVYAANASVMKDEQKEEKGNRDATQF